MARNNAANLDVTNNADGAQIGGGITQRILKWLGANITLTGSGSNTYTFPSATDTLVGRASTDTLTNKTLTSPVINTSVSGSAVKDEDDMASDSTTHLATQQSIKAYVDNYWQTIYPVGAVYISVSSTSPSTLFGGTWVAFGAGKVLVGLDSGDTDFDTSEETGGVKNVTLTAAQSGLPAHSHNLTTSALAHSFPAGTTFGGTGFGRTEVTGTSNNSAAAASEAHTNLQPYIVVYMWKRTA